MKKNNIETNLFDDLISFTNFNDEIIDVNDIFINIFKKTKEELLGKKESEVLNIKPYSHDLRKLLHDENFIIYDETINLQNELRYFKTKKELIIDKDTNIKKIKTSRKDITSFKQYEIQYNEDKRLLKHIAYGKDNEIILNEIIKSVEDRNSNMLCSILLLDESKKILIKGAAPSLPDFYTSKLNYMEIGDKVGSCGAAVYLKKRVVVSDISTHENWKYAKNLASKANLSACWSQPFFSSNNEILGSFAIYYKEKKEPSDFDIYLIEDIASIVGIAVERHQFTLKEKEYKQKQKEQAKLLFQKTKMAAMGEMLENIAHQWRQPLSIISAHATGIKLKNQLNMLKENELNDSMNNINNSVQHLSQTINDFRDFFKSNKKKNMLILNTTFEKTFNLIDSQFSTINLTVIKNIEDIEFLCFENELIQVLINILNNAIDAFVKQEQNEKLILIDAYLNNNCLEIFIKDNAGGIPTEIIDEIFNSHFTTKQDANGTGIGLYMSKMIIEEHMNGTIDVINTDFTYNNKSHKGAQFRICLPIIKE